MMNRTFKLTRSILLTLFAISLFSACGNDNGTTTLSLNGAEYVVVTEGTLQNSSSSITGTGSLVFNDPLDAIPSKHSFTLSFTLEEGGSVTLVSHATDSLQNGINVLFARNGTTLTVTLTAAGSNNDVSSAFTTVDASGTVTLQFDVHNDEEPAHLLAWTGDEFHEEDAIFNSEEGGSETPGNGSGTYWGLILAKATVETAAVGEAKFHEDH